MPGQIARQANAVRTRGILATRRMTPMRNAGLHAQAQVGHAKSSVLVPQIGPIALKRVAALQRSLRALRSGVGRRSAGKPAAIRRGHALSTPLPLPPPQPLLLLFVVMTALNLGGIAQQANAAPKLGIRVTKRATALLSADLHAQARVGHAKFLSVTLQWLSSHRCLWQLQHRSDAQTSQGIHLFPH